MALPQYDHYMTEAEYLVFERESDIRHEYVNGEIYAMSGASNNHILITGNLVTTLNNQLADSPCLVMSTDLRVKIKQGKSYRYPDLTVVCEDPEMVGESNPQSMANPKVIFEVLSPSTASIDHIEKKYEYFQIPTVNEYLLVSQDKAHIERYLRQDDDTLLNNTVSGLDAIINLPSINCTLRLSEVYKKVTFESEDTSGE